MERTDILALMGDLKLYGMRTAYDEVMSAGIKRLARAATHYRRSAEGRDRGKTGPVDQVPDDHRQAAVGQGHRRL